MFIRIGFGERCFDVHLAFKDSSRYQILLGSFPTLREAKSFAEELTHLEVRLSI